MSFSSTTRGPLRILFVSAYRGVSLATAILYESVRTGYGSAPPPAFLFRDYTEVETRVDESTIRDILLFAPDLIACSAFFWTFERDLRLASRLKAIRPELAVVMGGPELGHVDHARGILESHPQVDIAVCGEADVSFRSLLALLHEGEPPKEMAGIVYRDGDSVHVGPSARALPDLSELPVIYHDDSEYVLLRLRRNEMVPIETLRGCSSRCDYCLYALGDVRYFDLAKVEAEVGFLQKQGIRRVRVCDGHFGGSRRRAMELFRLLERAGPGITYHIYPHIAHIDEEYIRAAKRARCRFVSVGLQSSDPAVTGSVHRPTDTERIREAYALMHRFDMAPQLDLIYGFPGQTKESVSRDLRFIEQIGAERVLFSPLMVFPGTPLYDQQSERDIDLFPSPQNFGYWQERGLEGHAALMRRIEAHRIAEAFPHSAGFLRTRIAALLSELLAGWDSRPEMQQLITRVSEAISSAAAYLQRHRGLLAERFADALVTDAGLDDESGETLRSCVRLDLAILLCQTLREEGTGPSRTRFSVLTEKRLWQFAWRLRELSWMESFSLEAGQTSYLFEPAYRRNMALTEDEATLLRRFQTPRFLPVEERVAPKGVPEALDWIERGTLEPVELATEGLLERFLADRERFERSLDVVYVLGTGSRWSDNELRFSLRSIERYLSGLRNVYVVGHKPDWLRNVVHIPAPDPYRQNKDANMIHKLLIACQQEELSPAFVAISDDQLLLAPIHAGELRPCFETTLHDKPPTWFERTAYRRRHSRNTVEALEDELGRGRSLFCYNTHTPRLVHKLEFATYMRRQDYPTMPLSMYTLYFNLALRTHEPIRNRRAQIMQPMSGDEIRRRCEGRLYLGYRDKGLNDALKRFLADRFPEPSKYEGDTDGQVQAPTTARFRSPHLHSLARLLGSFRPH